MTAMLLALVLSTADAATTLAECGAPEHEPAALLPDPAELRPEVVPVPAAPLLPDPQAVAVSTRDADGLGLLGALMVALAAVGRRRRGPAAALVVAGAGCLALSVAVRREVHDIDERLARALQAGRAGEHEAALALLGSVRQAQQQAVLSGRSFAGWRAATDDLDIDALVVANGVAALRAAIARDDLDAALAAVELLPAGDPVALQASLAALTRETLRQHEGGRRAAALDHAERAAALAAGDRLLRANLCRTRTLRAVELAIGGAYDEALGLVAQVEPDACETTPRHLSVLRGMQARAAARAVLADPKHAEPERAVAALEGARDHGLAHGGELVFLTCDLAGALEAAAVEDMLGGQPRPAVEALDRSAALVPGREATRVLLPQALVLLAAELLVASAYDEAIEALERAHLVAGPDDADTREALVQGWLAKGAARHQAGDLDGAVEAFRRARQVDAGHEGAELALADTLMQRSEVHLRAGRSTAAVADLDEVAEASPRRRAAARAVKVEVGSLSRDLARMGHSPSWLRAPELVAGVPRDVDLDGQVDLVAYYEHGRSEPRAFRLRHSDWIDRGSLLLTAAGIGSEVVAILLDLDGDGGFDERQAFSGGRLDGLLADLDGDGRPDVRAHASASGGLAEEPLSGRVEVVIEEGVVRVATDPASNPDAYVKLFHNHSGVSRTSTAGGTYHPTWRQGVVIDYRHGDRVRLELWDEDLRWDDLVDTWETDSLPRSGVVVMDQRKAALRLSVRPSTLPAGHRVVRRAEGGDTNVFRDAPWLVPEAADVIAGARLARARTQVEQLVTEVVIVELLLPRLLPHATPAQLFFTGLALDLAVLDPLTGD